MKVVSMIISTSAENVVCDRIGWPCNIRVLPRPAKIKPTSPRGIIPTPMARRSTPRSSTPNAQICFPITAARVIDRGEAQDRQRREAAQVHAEAHQDEEHRDDQRGQREQELLHLALSPFQERLIMNLFENDARREGSHDRRQSDQPGKRRQDKAETDT